MSDNTSNRKSLPDLAAQRRAELSAPHPADIEASRLRRELAETAQQLQRARRGAKARGAATLARKQHERAAIGRAYAAAKRRRAQSSTISELIEQRDRALRQRDRWRWIARQQREDPERGTVALAESAERARVRAESAECRSQELRDLLIRSQERVRQGEEAIEDLSEYRTRFFEATAQIRDLETALTSASAYARDAERWMADVAAQLSALLPTLGPPPPLPPPQSNE